MEVLLEKWKLVLKKTIEKDGQAAGKDNVRDLMGEEIPWCGGPVAARGMEQECMFTKLQLLRPFLKTIAYYFQKS